jgi:hypothetical protein
LLIDFLPKVADLNVDHVAPDLELILPHMLEQHPARYQLVGMTKEIYGAGAARVTPRVVQ